MKLQLLTLAIAVSLLILAVKADDKPKKHKKVHRHHNKKHAEDLKASEELMQSDDPEMMQSDQAAFSDAEAKLHAAELEREVERAKEKLRGDQEKEEENNNVFLFDPCTRVHCGAGRICKLNDDNEAECVCIETCPEESNPRRKTCSNHNETWGSDCAIYQHRCWCDSGDERCRGEQYRHVHIEYYGECRDMPKCTDEEMSDFPRRMRDWLFNIMRDLADRQELKPHYLQLEREAETNLTRRWANAAIWKWCDLDGHPHDRSISRHELFPIRAPLMALEHCIAPFLNNCDTNDDHRITLKEWGKCLEIEEEEIEDKCEELDNDDS